MASFKAQKALGPAYMQLEGSAFFATDKIILGATPGLGSPAPADTIDFLIPAGARLAKLDFFLDDCDTGATFLFGVGYRTVNLADAIALPTNATYFAAAGQAIGQTGGGLKCIFKPIKFEVDVYVQLLVGAAPAGLAGNPEIHIIAGYDCEGVK